MKTIDMLTDVRDPSGSYFKGERRIVLPEIAYYFCAQGWARDVSGEIATGEPDTSPKTLEVQNGSVGHTATTLTTES